MSMRSTAGLAMACTVGGIIQFVIVSALHAAADVAEQDDKGRAGMTEKNIRFFYDPKPERGVPLAARDAGTAPHAPSPPGGSTPNIAFRMVRDLKDYGALRNVIRGSVAAIKIRYFDAGVIDRARVEPFLKALLASESGNTHSFAFWAEALGVPMIEAYIHFQAPSNPGYLLVWSGRAVYRDPSGKWWFTASPMIGPAK